MVNFNLKNNNNKQQQPNPLYYWREFDNIFSPSELTQLQTDIYLYYQQQIEQEALPRRRFWNPIKGEIIRRDPAFELTVTRLEQHWGTIKEIAVLMLAGDTSTLHTDHTAGLNRGVQARLNLPIANCGGSSTAFFQIPPGLPWNTSPGGTRTWDQQLRYVLRPETEVELRQPTILRTSSPHTVFIRTRPTPIRISLTVSFEKDLVALLDDDPYYEI